MRLKALRIQPLKTLRFGFGDESNLVFRNFLLSGFMKRTIVGSNMTAVRLRLLVHVKIMIRTPDHRGKTRSDDESHAREQKPTRRAVHAFRQVGVYTGHILKETLMLKKRRPGSL